MHFAFGKRLRGPSDFPGLPRSISRNMLKCRSLSDVAISLSRAMGRCWTCAVRLPKRLLATASGAGCAFFSRSSLACCIGWGGFARRRRLLARSLLERRFRCRYDCRC